MENEKGLAFAKPLENVARPAGFEPTTPWFVGLSLSVTHCFIEA